MTKEEVLKIIKNLKIEEIQYVKLIYNEEKDYMTYKTKPTILEIKKEG